MQALQRLVAVQVVDLAHAAHADAATLIARHVAQPVVERGRAQVERAVQALAFALQSRTVVVGRLAVGDAPHGLHVIDHQAPDHAAFDQDAEAFGDHLAATEQPLGERPEPAAGDHRRVRFEFGIQRMQRAAVGRVVDMPQHQRVAERVGQRADADLQRAAVAHQRAGVEADGVIDVADRLPRQREQLRIRCRRGNDDVEEVCIHRRAATDPRQPRIDFRDQQRPRQAARDDGVDRVGGEVGVRRQRQARTVRVRRDFLHQRVHAAVGERGGDVGVVEAGVAALRLRGMQQRAGLQVELLDFDVRGQGVAFLRGDIGQAREVLAVDALDEGIEEARFEFAAGRRGIQRQRGVQAERARRVAFDPRVQRVEETMRLAQPQRCADFQRSVDSRQQCVDGGVQRIEADRGGARGHGRSLARLA